MQNIANKVEQGIQSEDLNAGEIVSLKKEIADLNAALKVLFTLLIVLVYSNITESCREKGSTSRSQHYRK